MRHAIAVLKLPRAKHGEVVSIARAIVSAMAQSPHFPSPSPPLSTIEQAIEALSTAQIETLQGERTSFSRRNDARRHLVELLGQLRSYVQRVVHENPEQGVSIIEAALMHAKATRGRAANVFEVRRGALEGSAVLRAPRAVGRAAYEWAMSLDGGVTWSVLPVTTRAKTQADRLPIGKTVLFRYRVSAKNETGDWSQPFEYLAT